ncbi:MAG: hypothetical protein QF731_03600 [Verrucomicrobiota bacterium]|jgi:hypothetical protein|nr:hypothetical protein [Verrucomicrobiota bacterium]
MKSSLVIVFFCAAIALNQIGCISVDLAKNSKEMTFHQDVDFLEKHVEVITLDQGAGKSKIAVVPAYQGRVMTSTVGGAQSPSHGWINYELIKAGRFEPHINAYGGEDRFWLGPEGGQFSIFFKKDDPFDLKHWQTPALIDTQPYQVISQTESEVTFRHEAEIRNYSDTQFFIRIDRKVRLLDRSELDELLGVELSQSINAVAYETENILTNIGDTAWTKQGGLLSIWILGMYKHSEETTVLVPYVEGNEADLGPIVNADYFGEVPAERLRVSNGLIRFSADGKFRSKIGLSPERSKSVLGSYDPTRQLLTLVQYNKPEGATSYVNSMWELQDEPFKGDVVNSYNDGPPSPGAKQLGPFYELESSSPALELKSGESITHIHRTIHLQGEKEVIQDLGKTLLGAIE